MGYEPRVGKAYTRGVRRSCAVFIVGLVLGVAMVATLLWVIGGRDAGANGYRPLYALAVPLFFMGALGLAGALFVVARNQKEARTPTGFCQRVVSVRSWVAPSSPCVRIVVAPNIQ